MKMKQILKKGIKYFYALTLLLGLLMTNEMNAQKNTTISGVVKDEAGLTMPGVNIIEKGTNNSANTDFDGKFSLKLTTDNAVLTVSFISYQTQTIVVSGKSKLTIKLKSEEQSLKEVVVVGYGSVKKADITGSVSTISSAVITERNVLNPMEAIHEWPP
jgi:ribosomal protein S8E